MNPYAVSVVSCLLLFAGMPASAMIGHRVGRRLHRGDPDAKKLSTGVVDAAILSLLGLLTAFTFSSAYSRYETRRQLVVDEANAIGTAYLRVDLLPASAQPVMRDMFRGYVNLRAELWRVLPDPDIALAEYERGDT